MSHTATVNLNTPTARHRRTTLHVDPDVVSGDARELFGHAHCHALAVELHRASGWPLAIVERRNRSGEWTWDHVVVADPATADKPRGIDYIDIEGRRDDEQLCADRSMAEADATWSPPKRRRVRRLAGEHELRPLVGASAELDPTDWHVRCIPMNPGYAGFVARQARALLREVGAPPSPIPPDSAPPTGASRAPATTSTTRTTGGAMSIEEVQAGLSEVESRTSAAAGQLAGVHHEIDGAATLLSQLAQGSRDEDVRDALGQLQVLRDELDQLGQRALRVGEQAMSYAGRL